MSPAPDRRPRFPCAPLAPLALAVVTGIIADRFAQPWGTATWCGIALVAVVVVAVAFRWPRLQALGLIVAFAALGGGWHHRWWSDLADDDLARHDWTTPRPAWLRGVLAEVPEFRPGERSDDAGTTRTVLGVTGLSDGRRWRPASGYVQVFVSGDRSSLRMGEPVQAAGQLAEIAGPLNPGEYDRRISPRSNGIRLRLSVDEPGSLWPDPNGVGWPFYRWMGVARTWSHDRLVRGLDPEAAPLASALLLGRREEVDPDVNDAFLRTGTTHLLAISGLHLQALAVALWLVFRLVGLGRKPAFAGVMVATTAYALLVGLMPSVVRSAVMTLLICYAGQRDRYTRPANLLSVAALGTLAWNPAYLFDVGCQLSFLCVAALFWGVPPLLRRLGHRVGTMSMTVADVNDFQADLDPLDELERRLEPEWKKRLRRWQERLVQGVVISIVIWLASVPLVALRFHLVSPIGVALNIPLIPLTSLALMAAGLSLGLSAVWPPLGQPASWACVRLLGATESIVRWGAARSWGHAFVAGPAWGWVLGFYALLALVTIASVGRWHWKRWAWIALGIETLLGLIAAVLPTRPGALEADVLAVGHGLAVVIQGPDGRAVLYDCGQLGDPHIGRRVIAPALWSRGLHRLDAVILSHADADHYNGLPDLLDRFAIREVCVPPGFAGPTNPGAARLLARIRAHGVPVREIASGERLRLGADVSLEVLHPPADWQPSAPDNARSVVLDVASRGRHFLLTGDLAGAGLAELMARPSRRFDAVLSPHHGAKTSNPRGLYAWADPGLVVASQRRPPAGSRDALGSLGVPVLRTWQSGAIRLRWTGSGLAARGFLGDPIQPGDDVLPLAGH